VINETKETITRLVMPAATFVVYTRDPASPFGKPVVTFNDMRFAQASKWEGEGRKEEEEDGGGGVVTGLIVNRDGDKGKKKGIRGPASREGCRKNDLSDLVRLSKEPAFDV
jgi:hypothetical protein